MTYWWRFGLWHCNSVAQTFWGTVQDDTVNRNKVNTNKQVNYRNYKKPVKQWQDSPWLQLCTCLPPFSQTLVSQRCWWLQSWTPSPGPPVETIPRDLRVYTTEKQRYWKETGEMLTLKMSREHCVRMVLKVEDSPSSTKLSKWVIFSVSVSSRVCSSVLLSIRAKHLKGCKKCMYLKINNTSYVFFWQKWRIIQLKGGEMEVV